MTGDLLRLWERYPHLTVFREYLERMDPFLTSEPMPRCRAGEQSFTVDHLGNVSPFGAFDMSGNVEEWVDDWYGETMSDLSPRAGASHVLRGGGWLTPPSLSKTTSRNWGSVREAGANVGFRCARDD